MVQLDTANSGDQNIWNASNDGDLDSVKLYIEKNGLSPDSQDAHGYCPLHAAVSYGHYELAKYLIEKGATVNLPDECNETPLHFCEDVQCAQLLIEHGADANLKNSDDATPYQSALEDENFELAEFLKNFTNNAKKLQSKNNLSHVDYDGNADYKDHPEVDLNAPFLAQFEEVLKDSTFESEEKRDEKLNDLVLNLLHSHAKSRTTSTPKDF